MASRIETLLNTIATAIYGRDMRSAIHDSIQECYSDVSTARTIADGVLSDAQIAINNSNQATSNAIAATNDTIQATEQAQDATTDAITATNNATAATASAQGVVTAAGPVITRAENAAALAETNAANAANKATLANTAAELATTKASLADAKAILADSKATLADNAATRANNATNQLLPTLERATQASVAAESATSSATSVTETAREVITTANSVIADARQATTNANTAYTEAHTAATTATNRISDMDAKIVEATEATSSASIAAYNADVAKNSANRAADRADSAAQTIEGLTVSSTNVPYTAPATVTLQTDQSDGHKNLYFELRQGNPGPGFVIKGDAYATISDLESDITNPEIGDCYNVGSMPPYYVYRWTGTIWENQGELGNTIDLISAEEVAYIQNGGTIEPVPNKALGITGLTYMLTTLEQNLLSGKVDKVTGKGLSTNDFTDAYKQSIDTLESSVSTLSTNKVDKVTGKGLSTNDFTNAYKGQVDTNTTAISGLQSDKVDKVTGKGLSANDFTDILKNKLDGIEAGATNIVVDIALDSSSSNPVQNSVVTTALSTKVDKVTGKGLSANDFTDILKNKLDGIDMSTKQDHNIYLTNIMVSSWETDPDEMFEDYPVRGTISVNGATSNMYSEVVFNPADMLSIMFAPVCCSDTNCVYVYAAEEPETEVRVLTLVLMK